MVPQKNYIICNYIGQSQTITFVAPKNYDNIIDLSRFTPPPRKKSQRTKKESTKSDILWMKIVLTYK